MRTTLNIDEELLAAYERLAARSRASLSDVIQDALREALTLRQARAARPPIRLLPFAESGGLVDGADLAHNASLSEMLEQPNDEALRRQAALGAST
jgi:predicted transcriptional regulator